MFIHCVTLIIIFFFDLQDVFSNTIKEDFTFKLIFFTNQKFSSKSVVFYIIEESYKQSRFKQ